jgi:Cdc6-like AAA superfamily ATPase
VSCKAEGGKPAPNVVLIIDGETVTSRTQSVQHTLNTINRSYDRKTVTCQAGNPAYSQDPISSTAVIHINCK